MVRRLSLIAVCILAALCCAASTAGTTPARAACGRDHAGMRARSAASQAVVSMVSFANTRYGWASGSMGALLRTTDGGAHWKRQYVHGPWLVDQDAYVVEARSSKVCWAVGSAGGIFRTTDAGKNWIRVAKKLRPSAFAGNTWSCCDFAGKTGWIVSTCGDIIGTKNGGKTWTWQRRAEDAGNDAVGGFSATTTGHAYVALNAAGGHYVLANSDGGSTWKQVGDRPFLWWNPDFRGVWAENATRVWLVARLGEVFLSEDSGATWRVANPGVGPDALIANGIGGYGTTVCAIGSRSGTTLGAAVLSSNDGFAWGWVVFAPAGVTAPGDVASIAWANEKTGWVTERAGRIWRTQDGGLSWKRLR